MAPYREEMVFLQNPWIFGNFRKLGANSEKIEKIASRDFLEQKTAPHVRCDGYPFEGPNIIYLKIIDLSISIPACSTAGDVLHRF